MSRYRLQPGLRDVNGEAPAAHCDNPRCRTEVYSGGARFLWGGRLICRECFRASVRKLLWEDPEQMAAEMGVEVERYD